MTSLQQRRAWHMFHDLGIPTSDIAEHLQLGEQHVCLLIQQEHADRLAAAHPRAFSAGLGQPADSAVDEGE